MWYWVYEVTIIADNDIVVFREKIRYSTFYRSQNFPTCSITTSQSPKFNANNIHIS